MRSWRAPGRRTDCRSLRSPRAGRFPFSIIFQLGRSENRKNAANPAFFELNCKLPKLRTWVRFPSPAPEITMIQRSEEHTSELQSLRHLVCRLLLENKKEHECATTP